MADVSALERIRERLRHEGRLTFAAFMAEALYGPAGYYTRRARLGGTGADFFTSSELHPAFGALLGRFARRVWTVLGRPPRFDLAEYGPGSGALCRDLLIWASHDAPDFLAALHYRLVERSPFLRETQRETLASVGLLDAGVSWEMSALPGGRLRPTVRGMPSPHCPEDALTPLPPLPHAGEGEQERWVPISPRTPRPPHAGGEGRSGLILANEVVDALPVHLVTVREGRLLERYVTVVGERLTWLEDEPSTPTLPAYFEHLGIWPGEGCLAEVNLEAVPWMEQVAATLGHGALLVLDYGYPAADLYAPSRRYGTLLTYRAHTLGSDPLVRVGEQDITAHVDFTSLARAGERAGLETVGLISQTALLRRLGLDAYLGCLDAAPIPAWDHDANRRALLALVDPGGLGRVQALLQTRGLPGFDPLMLDAHAASSWLPLLRSGQMRLPGPLDAEGYVDVEGLWQEFLEAGEDAGSEASGDTSGEPGADTGGEDVDGTDGEVARGETEPPPTVG
ncbi:MAG: SAM-dependent methyltransferase [Chloroflexi bacterium]|nr:SAM-dependent methyltransferase [Chloroflexota bacterium]